MRDKIIELCEERNDKDSQEIQGLESCFDRPAAEALYHRQYYQRFLKKNQRKGKVGCPSCPEFADTFQKFCYWYENLANTELLPLPDVLDKLSEISPGIDIYSSKYLKKKLEGRYGDHIFFAEVNGCKNATCFRNMVNFIVNNNWYEKREENIETEAKHIVMTAAYLIREEIHNINYNDNVYPDPEAIKDSDPNITVPDQFKTFVFYNW